ncbi:MAG: hypothetical protein C7B44_06415 [Sulfobacillus thermosulfidooxidans]|nr:MAG: hypothetical protein C7B44_06415 [Sulfobacillus thermosulfidooxidans]
MHCGERREELRAMMELSKVISDILGILPWPFVFAGLIAMGAYRNPGVIKKMVLGASVVTLLLAGLDAVLYFVGWSTAHHAPLGSSRGLGAWVDVNVLTILMSLLVSFVGLVVTRYAYTYMRGDVHEGRFHQWLSLTLGSFLWMIAASNLWTFFIFWIAASLSLHPLLAFYRGRPAAVLTARKKYFVDRLADGSLLVAFILIARTLHTAQFAVIGSTLMNFSGPLPFALQLAGGLLIVSAVLKSAQFPFHGWLIQVMEAPTPVSAVLHAGIIYTGVLLLLRLEPLVAQETWTGDVLIGIGLLSMISGSLMMMAASNIKASLAYSTHAQMSFVLIECGLGLYSLALLHIMSHAVYKAHAFLSSGSVVEQFRSPKLQRGPVFLPASRMLMSVGVALGSVVGVSVVMGLPLFAHVPLLVMETILLIALIQMVMLALTERAVEGIQFVGLIMGLSVGVSLTFLGLGSVFNGFLATLWPPVAHANGGVLQYVLWGLIIVSFVGLLFVQYNLPRIRRHPWGLAIYLHLYTDYVDMIVTRWVRQLWGCKIVQASVLPAAHPSEVLS